MKRLFPILAAGIMVSLSITAGIGAVHAQKKPRPGITARSRQGTFQWAWASPRLSTCPRMRRKSCCRPGGRRRRRPVSAQALCYRRGCRPDKRFCLGSARPRNRRLGAQHRPRRSWRPAANSTRGDASGRDHRADDQRYDHPDRSRRFHRRRATRHRHSQRLRAEALRRWPFRRPRRWPAWRGGNHDWLGRQCAHHTRSRSGNVEGDRRGSTARYRQAARDHHKLADPPVGALSPNLIRSRSTA